MADDSELRDIHWKMFQEHCTHGRQHENQRSLVISCLIAVSAAVIGVITYDKTITTVDLPLTFFLVALGFFGAGFSMKHYERFRKHMEHAHGHRNALDAMLPGNPLAALRHQANMLHMSKFPLMHKLSLHYWWVSLNLIIALIGLVLSAVALWWPRYF